MVVNESLLQLWDYFMVAGWNAVLKMGVYILSSHSNILLQMPFEDILPEINEFVCSTLPQSRSTQENLFKMISKEFKDLKLSFHIERLQIEFEQSHREVQNQPLKNKQLNMQMLPQKPLN